jgi:hypothetical protein
MTPRVALRVLLQGGLLVTVTTVAFLVLDLYT